MRKKLMMLALAITGCLGIANAQQPAVVTSDKTGWHKIAETTVAFVKDRDEVVVLGADRFAAIKFKVTDAPIHLMDLTLYYEDDTKQDINVNFPIKPKGESREIDLDGKERSIKKIVFVYKTVSEYKEEKAHVEIWGLKTNTVKN
jgi:hypothetical protein